MYTLTPQEAIRKLESSQKGLSKNQVHIRQKKYGPNQLKVKKKRHPIFILVDQFKSFIIYILLFAVFIAFISGEYVDATVIMIILVFNALFGFFQEYRASKAIEALKKLSGLQITVLRDGVQQKVETKDLVPGDIIFVEEGTKIPAGARILEATRLRVSESSLTGESVPVSKTNETLKGECIIPDQKNMFFSGTTVVQGHAKAIVTTTGMNTQIGKIANMLNDSDDEETPLQIKLDKLGKWIGIITILICIFVFLVGVYKGNILPLLLEGNVFEFILEAKDWFLVAVSLAVAAVPEGLPAIVTIALALGVRKMVKKNALIRKLPSVETLGETTIICSDKTGTLTTNQMTVRKAYVNGHEIDIFGEGYSYIGDVTQYTAQDELLFICGALCNNATVNINGNITGDPTEAALIVSAKKAKVNVTQYTKKDEIPFDSVRKMMSTLHSNGKKSFVFTKGAPGLVLNNCTHILEKGKKIKLTKAKKDALVAKQNEYASQALRVLGFAYKETTGKISEKELVFIGIQGMIDPPHKEVKSAIATCHEAGIKVIMITGDNKITAQAIAHEIGIEGDAMNGADFGALSVAKQKQMVEKIAIFSRVEPEHKMNIVTYLQKKGHIVTMTGDGVNDAPAIKKADLGIAMGISGTDVAKESSDMILLDDNFSSIVDAIQEGRGIYENITKFVNYLLSSNLAEVMIIFFAILFGLPLPMTAIMLLWLNLVTDGLPALALSFDPTSPTSMKRAPKKASEGIMNMSMGINIAFVSILITGAILALFIWAQNLYQDSSTQIIHIQTIAFTALIVMEIIRLQIIRAEYGLGLFTNRYLIGALLISFGLQLLVIYSPLSIFFGTYPLNVNDWIAIFTVSAAVWIITQVFTYFKDILYDNKIAEKTKLTN